MMSGMDLIRGTLWLMAVAVVVAMALRWSGLASARIRRCAYGLVLFQGLLIAPWSLALPWLPVQDHVSVMATNGAVNVASNDATDLPQAMTRSLTGAEARSTELRDRQRQLAAPIFRWSRMLEQIWLIGCLVVTAGHLVSYGLLLALARRAEAAPPLWQKELDSEFQPSRRPKVRLLVHDSLGPMLCRLPWRWAVIVPKLRWAQLTRRQRQAVLRHEALHWRRGDVWMTFLSKAAATLHWFNPFAWWAAARFEQCAEWSCDERMAKEDPEIMPALAEALLHFNTPSEANEGFPLAAAANGAPLTTRLTRMLVPARLEDSRMKRLTVAALLLTLATAGAVRIRLVAQEPASQTEEASSDNAAFLAELQRLQRELPDGDFKKALATEEGRLVMRDRAEQYVEEARAAAEETIFERFLAKRFSKMNGKFVPNPKDPKAAEQFLATVGQFNQDVARVKDALATIDEKLDGNDEATQLASRFLKNQGPMMLYVHELRNLIRPTSEMIEYRLRELLVRDSAGNYAIREDHREEAEELAKRVLPALEAQATIHRTLKEWSTELAAPDTLHKRAKAALVSAPFAVFIAAQFEDKGRAASPRALANRIADQLDEATNVSLKGLVFRVDNQEEIARLLGEFDRRQKAAALIKPVLVEVAGRITARDELHKTWARLLSSDLGAMKLAEDVEDIGEPGDLHEVVMDMLGEVFIEKQGRLVVDPDRKEDVLGQIQEAMRDHRRVLRHGRVLDDMASEFEDAKAQAALRSDAAKFVAAMLIEQELRSMQVNGLKAWMKDHLVRREGGWAVSPDSSEEIVEFLNDVRQVKEQLSKDDF